jgi:hypothetical protein
MLSRPRAKKPLSDGEILSQVYQRVHAVAAVVSEGPDDSEERCTVEMVIMHS